MTLCQIVGHAIAPVAHPSLTSWKLALCQRLDADGKPDGTPPVVAIDPLGAGLDQIVLMTTDGKAAMEMTGDPRSPVRNSIIGLVDQAQSGFVDSKIG